MLPDEFHKDLETTLSLSLPLEKPGSIVPKRFGTPQRLATCQQLNPASPIGCTKSSRTCAKRCCTAATVTAVTVAAVGAGACHASAAAAGFDFHEWDGHNTCLQFGCHRAFRRLESACQSHTHRNTQTDYSPHCAKSQDASGVIRKSITHELCLHVKSLKAV